MSDRTPSAADAGRSGDPNVGRLLDGRYRIGVRIARGGMASVYEALDTRLDRTIAIKIMHPGLGDDEEFAARFVREARAAAKLSHPNIVAVFDQGNDDGVVYLAMELVNGSTLRDVIARQSPMSPLAALTLLEPVVSALAAAHRAGLMHRDVKPENVLIADEDHNGSSTDDPARRVKVADFGLAKAISAETQHTATGVLIGTVSYVAPELVVEGKADARADVYAVGVITYELLTGVKPHQGESPIQVAYKHVHEDVPAPSERVAGIPAYVDALVARATSRDLAQRPSDAGVLLHHLRRVRHALAAGVTEDADLTSDLRPLAVSTATSELVGVEEIRDRLHDSAAAALPVTPEEATVAVAMAPVPRPPAPRPPAQPVPALPSEHEIAVIPEQRAARRRRRFGPLYLALAVLVAAAIAGGAWWFGYGRYTSLPSVLDLTQAAATTKLDDAGFTVKIGTSVFSDEIAAGHVVSTDPRPGSRVLGGATVTLVISKGVEQYPVPKVVGKKLTVAKDLITAAHLDVGLITKKYSETVPEGVVISVDPSTGTMRRPGAAVQLVVSKGRKPIPVGDWIGKLATRAEKALTKRGLHVEKQEIFSDDVAKGRVIDQAPRNGTLFRGETITLTISKGPDLVEVPRTIGKGVAAATTELEALGFTVDVEHSDAYIGLGYVLHTSPSAGDKVPRGSTITLYLV